MQVHELYQLAQWFFSANEKAQLLQTIDEGTKALTRTSNNVLAGNFNHERKQLLDRISLALSQFDSSQLTTNQKKILTRLGVDSILSQNSSEHFKSLLSKIDDKAFVVSTMQEHVENLRKAQSTLSVFRQHLPELANSKELGIDYSDSDKILTRITFKDKANIGNIAEFKEWGENWYTIARGFAISQGTSPESFEIVNTERGSVIIDMLLDPEIVKVISETVSSLANAVASIAEMYVALKTVQSLKEAVDNNTYETFVKKAEENLEHQKEKITEQVLEELKKQNLLKVDTADNELKKSIRTLAKFQESGGEIQCIAKGTEESAANQEAIEHLNTSVKRLKNKQSLKFLENKADDVEA